MFSGIGVIVDRESGAQRELLAAPIHRLLIVLGNLTVALAVTASSADRADRRRRAARDRLDLSPAGSRGSLAAAALLAVGMYGVAESSPAA
jgi:hypothetical protein